MAYYVELSGGKIAPAVKLSGGGIVPGARLSGGSIYATGSGGGGPVNLQSKSVSYTPTESAQTDQVTADQGYDGLSEVDVSVGAISSSYVGSAVPRKTSSDLSASGATVTAPSGYYENSASKAIANASTPYVSWASINNDGTVSYDIDVNSAGYIADDTFSGTTGNPQVTVQGAQTIYPSTSDQTIASGKYLTGAQTVKGVTTTNLTASNIKKDVVVEVGDADDPDRVLSVTGTYEGGGGGASVTDTIDPIAGGTIRTITASVASGTLPQGSALSKIILNGVTQMDLTADTVEADNLLTGETAHGADGEAVLGIAKGLEGFSGLVSPPTYDTYWGAMLSAFKDGRVKSGKITVSGTFSNTTERFLMSTGLSKIQGIMFSAPSYSLNPTLGTGQTGIHIILMCGDIGTYPNHYFIATSRTQNNNWANWTSGQSGVRNDTNPINGIIRFDGGDLYYTGRYNNNNAYQFIRSALEYEWLAWGVL